MNNAPPKLLLFFYLYIYFTIINAPTPSKVIIDVVIDTYIDTHPAQESNVWKIIIDILSNWLIALQLNMYSKV